MWSVWIASPPGRPGAAPLRRRLQANGDGRVTGCSSLWRYGNFPVSIGISLPGTTAMHPVTSTGFTRSAGGCRRRRAARVPAGPPASSRSRVRHRPGEGDESERNGGRESFRIVLISSPYAPHAASRTETGMPLVMMSTTGDVSTTLSRSVCFSALPASHSR